MALVIYNASLPLCGDPKRLPERSFRFRNIERQVVVKQRWKRDGKGGTELGFGSAQYEAGILLAQYLAENRKALLEGKHVLELGCGIGLVSVVCALSDCCSSILATDGDSTSVEICRANCRTNNVENLVQVEQLRWGTGRMERSFDVVVGADIVCLPYKEHFGALLDTLKQTTRPGSRVLIAYKKRDTVEDEFWHACKQDFYFRETIGPDRLDPDFQHHRIFLLVLERKNQVDVVKKSSQGFCDGPCPVKPVTDERSL